MRTESEMSFVLTLGSYCEYCKQKNDYYHYEKKNWIKGRHASMHKNVAFIKLKA